MRTFGEMVANVGSDIQDTSGNTNILIKKYINIRYKRILRQKNWDIKMLDYSFTTTVGKSDYVLPRDLKNPIYVIDSTNGRELSEQDLQFFANQDPSGISQNSVVSGYSIFNSRVAEQPTSASVVTIVSSSSADTTQRVLIRGIVDNVEQVEYISFNGIISASGSKSFSRIISISKDGTTTGYVTVTCNSQTIAVMSPDEKSYMVKIMRLYQVPSDSTTILCPYVVEPVDMLYDDDIPIIDVCDLLEIGARADLWKYKRQPNKSRQEEIQFSIELGEYLFDDEANNNKVQQFLPLSQFVDYNPDNLV